MKQNIDRFLYKKEDFFAPLLHWGLDQVQQSQVFLYLSCGGYSLYCFINYLQALLILNKKVFTVYRNSSH